MALDFSEERIVPAQSSLAAAALRTAARAGLSERTDYAQRRGRSRQHVSSPCDLPFCQLMGDCTARGLTEHTEHVELGRSDSAENMRLLSSSEAGSQPAVNELPIVSRKYFVPNRTCPRHQADADDDCVSKMANTLPFENSPKCF